MKRWHLAFLTGFLAAGLLLLSAPQPVGAQENQPPSDQQKQEQKKDKKKATKVWTNDDFPSHPPEPEKTPEAEAAAKEPGLPPDADWVELDVLRENRGKIEAEVGPARQKVEELRNDRLNSLDNPARVKDLEESIAAIEDAIADREDQLKKIDARIAVLEKKLKGKKRPAPQPAPAAQPAEGQQPPAAEQPPAPPPPSA